MMDISAVRNATTALSMVRTHAQQTGVVEAKEQIRCWLLGFA